VLQPEEDHLTAVNVMYNRRVKRLPVAKHGKLLGIISLSDLASVAKGDLEQLESRLMFACGVIKTQAVQTGPSSSPGSVKSRLQLPGEERTVTEPRTANNGALAPVS
jgi:hypothetical protein